MQTTPTDPMTEAQMSAPDAGSADAPHGWYYYGPQPPWQSEPVSGAQPDPDPGHDDADADYRDMMGAFESLSRGEFTAESFAKLFNLKDRDFWKGAAVGAAAALALSNLPQLKAMMAMMAASAQAAPAQTTPAPQTAPDQAQNGAQDDAKET